MRLDLTQNELALLETLLSKEQGDLRVEIIRSRDYDYERFLQQRKELVYSLLERVQNAMPVERHELVESLV